MLIVTGTGRSGTGTYARLFRGHHEFRVNYVLSKYLMKADQSGVLSTPAERIALVMDLLQGVDRENFVDSSNLYIHFIDAVAAVHRDAKFILGVRNGKDFVRSAFSRKWHERNSFGMMPLPEDPFFGKWAEMPPLQKDAWIWVSRNEKALRALDGVSAGRKLVVRIEDIEKREMLDLLESFSGIGIDRKAAMSRHNANPQQGLPPREQWSEEMVRQFDEVAGDMMKLLGYS